MKPSDFPPCGRDNLDEYYCVRIEDRKVRDVRHVKKDPQFVNNAKYYYCTEDYMQINSVDLCANCARKYGFVW